MSESIVSRQATPASIENIAVTSNDGVKSANLLAGIVNLSYYESILHDNVTATVTYADTGNSVNDKNVLETLPIVGTEKVSLKFKDNNDNIIEFSDTNNNSLYGNKVTPIGDLHDKYIKLYLLFLIEMFLHRHHRLHKKKYCHNQYDCIMVVNRLL